MTQLPGGHLSQEDANISPASTAESNENNNNTNQLSKTSAASSDDAANKVLRDVKKGSALLRPKFRSSVWKESSKGRQEGKHTATKKVLAVKSTDCAVDTCPDPVILQLMCDSSANQQTHDPVILQPISNPSWVNKLRRARLHTDHTGPTTLQRVMGPETKKVPRDEPPSEDAWLHECARSVAKAQALRSKPCWRAVNATDGCAREYCAFYHPTAAEAALLKEAARLRVKFPDMRLNSWFAMLGEMVGKARLLVDSFCISQLRGSCSRVSCRCSHGTHLCAEELELLRSAVSLGIRLPSVSCFAPAALAEKVMWRMKASLLPCKHLLAEKECNEKKCMFSHSIDLSTVKVCSDFGLGTCTRKYCRFRHPPDPLCRICVRALFVECDGKCRALHIVQEERLVLRRLAVAGAVFPRISRLTSMESLKTALCSGPFRFRPFVCRKHILGSCTE